jgi:hypothetical protein
MWTHVDDDGRAIDDARLVKAALFPLDDDVTVADIAAMLNELESCGRIIRYIGDGKPIFAVVGWREHQVINRYRPSTLPPPPDDSVTRQGSIPDASRIDQGRVAPGIGNKEGKGIRKRKGMDGAADSPTPARATKARKRAPIPTDFALDADLIAFARERGVDPDAEFERFVNHHTAVGSLFVDWRAAWRTWVSRAVGFKKNGRAPKGRMDALARAYAKAAAEEAKQ